MMWAVTEALIFVWALTSFLTSNSFRPADQHENSHSDRGEHAHTHLMSAVVKSDIVFHSYIKCVIAKLYFKSCGVQSEMFFVIVSDFVG